MTGRRDILRVLRTADRFLLSTHVNPDGDGLGSELALARALRAQGRQVRIVNVSPTPAVYRFLDPDGLLELYDPRRHDDVIRDAGAIVILDTNHPDRLRTMAAPVLAAPGVKLCIDHHLDPAPFADLYLLDDGATATGELVHDLLTELVGPDLPADIATPLYCAVMTDTGSFRYPRVSEHTHERIARLIAAGADPVSIYHNVYEQWTPGRIQLLGRALAALETAHDGRLAVLVITRTMLSATGTTEEDTDNFTVYPMSIGGARAGILFLELEDGVKVSFRSRGSIPINELAQQFGGNGHRNAAGARIDGLPLDTVVRRVVDAAAPYARMPDT